MNFDSYPIDCPDKNAFTYNEDIFIFVKNNPVLRNDLSSCYEKGRLLNADQCLRRAISCGISIEYLNSIQNLFPTKKGWKRAKGKLNTNNGLIAQTSNNMFHYSFWICLNSRDNLHEFFEVI